MTLKADPKADDKTGNKRLNGLNRSQKTGRTVGQESRANRLRSKTKRSGMNRHTDKGVAELRNKGVAKWRNKGEAEQRNKDGIESDNYQVRYEVTLDGKVNTLNHLAKN